MSTRPLLNEYKKYVLAGELSTTTLKAIEQNLETSAMNIAKAKAQLSAIEAVKTELGAAATYIDQRKVRASETYDYVSTTLNEIQAFETEYNAYYASDAFNLEAEASTVLPEYMVALHSYTTASPNYWNYGYVLEEMQNKSKAYMQFLRKINAVPAGYVDSSSGVITQEAMAEQAYLMEYSFDKISNILNSASEMRTMHQVYSEKLNTMNDSIASGTLKYSLGDYFGGQEKIQGKLDEVFKPTIQQTIPPTEPNFYLYGSVSTQASTIPGKFVDMLHTVNNITHGKEWTGYPGVTLYNIFPEVAYSDKFTDGGIVNNDKIWTIKFNSPVTEETLFIGEDGRYKNLEDLIKVTTDPYGKYKVNASTSYYTIPFLIRDPANPNIIKVGNSDFKYKPGVYYLFINSGIPSKDGKFFKKNIRMKFEVR